MAIWLLPSDQKATRSPQYRELLAAVRSKPGMRAPLLLAFLDRFTVGFFTAGFPLMLAGVHEVEPAVIGMLLAAFLYPFALLSYPFGRIAERATPLRLVAIGSLLYGATVSCVGIAPVNLMWVLMPLCGVFSAVMFIPTLLWLLDQSPGLGKTTAMAAFHSAGSLGFLLGPLVCGEIITNGDYGIAFAVAGMSEILAAILVVGVATRARRSSV